MKMDQAQDHLYLIKLLNRSNVLSLIKNEGPLSRVELSERTGLSRPTISAIVEELLAAKLIREVGKGPSSGGRRPILLEFNATAYYIMGALFEGTTLSSIITDLEGRIVLKDETEIANTVGDKAVEKVIEFLKNLYRKSRLPPKKLLGVGIGVPGIVDLEKETVSLAPSVGWIKNFPIKGALEEALGVPVIIENDVNAVTLGEMWKGVGRNVNKLAVFHVGTGIGAGLVIDGKLYRGYSGAAGEIGHLPIGAGKRNPDEFGIYEKNWACPAMRKFLRENFTDLPEEKIQFPIKTLIELSKTDKRAEDYLEEACVHWAYGIASIICVFNPELVILAGQLIHLGEKGIEKIKKKINDWVPFSPRIEFASLGELAGNIGAALSVLHSEEETIIENII